MSSKFYLMMLRDKDCNGKTYTFAYNMVSEKLDPKLYAKLHAKVEFKTVEEAEANAREIAKQLFIYDHTKRPKVLKDFRLYRWWILDAEKPVQVWCGCYHYGSDELDRGEFKTLAQLYPKDSCYGLNLRDALQRYVAKRPWTASNMRYSQIDGKTFAKFVTLPNHGMHLKACPWSLNLPKSITFWM